MQKCIKNAKLYMSPLCLYLSYRHIKSCCIADNVFLDASSSSASSCFFFCLYTQFKFSFVVAYKKGSDKPSNKYKEQTTRLKKFNIHTLIHSQKRCQRMIYEFNIRVPFVPSLKGKDLNECLR